MRTVRVGNEDENCMRKKGEGLSQLCILIRRVNGKERTRKNCLLWGKCLFKRWTMHLFCFLHRPAERQEGRQEKENEDEMDIYSSCTPFSTSYLKIDHPYMQLCKEIAKFRVWKVVEQQGNAVLGQLEDNSVRIRLQECVMCNVYLLKYIHKLSVSLSLYLDQKAFLLHRWWCVLSLALEV